MIPQIKISFFLAGDDVDLNVLTNKLQLQPTKVRTRDECPAVSLEMGLAHDMWEWQVPKEKSWAVSVQMNKLQSILYPKVEILKELCTEYALDVTVNIVIDMEAGDRPEMVLSKENINFLSLIDAKVGFDLYID